MNIDMYLIELGAFIITAVSGFYSLTKIESRILERIGEVNTRLDIHIADHKLIDFEVKQINKKLDK